MGRWLVGGVVLAGCGVDPEAPFVDGLEPLEDMAVEAPAPVDGALPEDFRLVVEEGPDHLWGHLRGYVHGDVAEVWAAYREPAVVTDRRRVAAWSARTDVDPRFDFSMDIDNRVEDLITVEYTLSWRHGAVGTVEAPEKVSMRWERTAGGALIRTLRGSVAVLPTEQEGVTEVQMVEHLAAPMTGPREIEGKLGDIYQDVVDTVHARELTEWAGEP
jgi:hypothetical protein